MYTKVALLITLTTACVPAEVPPPPVPAVVTAPKPAAPPPTPPASPCPPDAQVARDAYAYSLRGDLLDMAGLRPRPFKVVSKRLDKFERDVCVTVSTRSFGGGRKWLVFGSYVLQDGFHRLVAMDDRVY